MAQGMNMGIFTLLGVILSVLAGVAGFFVYLARRGAQLAEIQGGAAAAGEFVVSERREEQRPESRPHAGVERRPVEATITRS